MLDINLLRTNPELVKENIRKKFQNAKLPLVDEVIYDGESMTESTDKAFRLQVEAVKEDWLYEEPSSCVEAFEMFYKIKGQGETENL